MDFLIEGIGIIGAGYIAIGMALHLSSKFRRIDSNAVPSQPMPEPTAATATAVEDQSASVRCGNSRHASTMPQVEDRVVPFKRPQRQVSDTDLIKLAKGLARKGLYPKAAKKWSYNRKLSEQTRSELLRLALAS